MVSSTSNTVANGNKMVIQRLLRLSKQISKYETYRRGDCKKVVELAKKIQGDKVEITTDLDIIFSPKPNVEQKTSFGRYVRRRLNVSSDQISDNLLTICKGALSDIFASDCEFKIYYGDGLLKVYQEDSGFPCTCMTESEAMIFLAENPNKVGVATITKELPNGDIVTARSLVWTTDSGKKFHDTIYSDYKIGYEALKSRLAKELLPEANHEAVKEETITMENVWAFPYLDTFYIGRFKNKRKEIVLTTSREFKPEGCEDLTMDFDSTIGTASLSNGTYLMTGSDHEFEYGDTY